MRVLIVALVGLAAGLAAVGGWRFARASAPVNGPVILISVDGLRADRLSAYGDRNAHTPAIDALAADGILFEHAYAHVPQTRAAYAALLTGKLPFETGVRGARAVLNKKDRLIAPMLRDRGYATAGVVSDAAIGRESGLAEGVDFFDAEMPPPDGPALPETRRRSGDASLAVAERWLEMQRSPRLFLFLQIADAAAHAPYDERVSASDAVVGRFVAWLKAHQMYDRSTIVVVSDHGEGLGDHGETGHGLFVYDDTLHVPLIVKQPGGDGHGRRVASAVQMIDIAPTILDLVRAPIPGSLRGQSLTRLLSGDDGQADREIYAESTLARDEFGWSPLASITHGRFRYIAAPREELYDLKSDPAEATNIAPGNPKVVASLRHALEIIAGRRTLTAAADPTGVDPKDRWHVVERYRELLRDEADGQWADALNGLRQLAAEQPDVPAVWRRLAELSVRSERFADAAHAFAEVADLAPDDPAAPLGAGNAYLNIRRFDDARDMAARALTAAGERKPTAWARIDAHLLLAEIAIARADDEAARDEGRRAQQVDVSVPGPSYVDARLLYESGDFDGAAEAFDRILAAIHRGERRPVAGLHYYAGDTFARVDREGEAESELLEALAVDPGDTRSRASLARLYHGEERDEDASRAIADMLRVAPAPDIYAQAARLWTAFGDRKEADAVRADARRLFRAR